MISSQIITEDNRPVTIVLDYSEYLRLKEIEENQLDYDEAVRKKRKILNGPHIVILKKS